MKLDIEKKDNKLYVTVSLKLRQKKNDRKKIKLEDIKKILLKRKIKHGKCLKRAKITNIDEKNCVGVFIFALPKPKLNPKSESTTTKPRKRRAPSPRRKYTKK